MKQNNAKKVVNLDKISKSKDKSRKSIGKKGEDIASTLLVKRGFKVISRNYLKRSGEIDIVAQKFGKLYFCEVKTVSREMTHFKTSSESSNRANYEKDVNHETFLAEENIDKRKLARLRKTIGAYLIENHVSYETQWALLVIVVKLDSVAKRGTISMFEA